MARLVIAAALVAIGALACASGSAPAPESSGPPDRWADHVRFMSGDGGMWVTANPKATDEPDSPDAFGMTWVAASEGRLLVGRLFGLKNGREVAEYWTFREYWHPGERRVVVQQWSSWGAYGEGETTSLGSDRWQLDQTFWLADGRGWREGHRTVENGDEYVTDVFDIDAIGNWSPRDGNVWRRVRE